MAAGRLLDYWGVVSANTDMSLKEVAEKALVAPARCCLKNIGGVGAVDENASRKAGDCPLQPEERLVETAFSYLKEISQVLRDRFDIPQA